MAEQVHPSFPEDPAVFTERMQLYPDGMHLLERDGRACGYLVSHPWHAGTAPALNALLQRVPPEADTFYLHDLALLPAARGLGAARLIVEAMAEHAHSRGLASMSLVAVNGSVPFWERLGFAVENNPALTEKLKSYEQAARFMVRKLA
nr:GNAT family N-acetyltransferase [uncultured Roseococcus sp.]